MRDPDSVVALDRDHARRSFFIQPPVDSFLRSPAAQTLVDAGQLLPFEWTGAQELQSPRVPFVSAPSNWCDAQFWDAADLTLTLESAAIDAGHELKDASAWNVVFQGAVPALCDHGSFRPLQGATWWAGGQFTRHFLLPLLLAQRRGFRASHALRVWRDGIPPVTAARMIGPSRYLTRYWPLMAAPRATPAHQTATGPAAASPGAPAGVHPEDAKQRKRLVEGLRFMLAGVRPPGGMRPSTWSGYTRDRDHYAAAALNEKLAAVREWLALIEPAWMADLGCNTGEFSEVALSQGSSVVALDADHECVQALYLRQRGERRLYPIVAELDDLDFGRGWAGAEQPGLASTMRGHFDLVLMLALIHHLAIGAAVPLHKIAELAAALSKRWLILELVDSQDVQLRRLCADRQRRPEDFSAGAQRSAFEAAGFAVRQSRALAGTARTLVLFEMDRRDER